MVLHVKGAGAPCPPRLRHVSFHHTDRRYILFCHRRLRCFVMGRMHDAVIEKQLIVVGSLHPVVQPHCHSLPRCPDIGLNLTEAPMVDHRLVAPHVSTTI